MPRVVGHLMPHRGAADTYNHWPIAYRLLILSMYLQYWIGKSVFMIIFYN